MSDLPLCFLVAVVVGTNRASHAVNRYTLQSCNSQPDYILRYCEVRYVWSRKVPIGAIALLWQSIKLRSNRYSNASFGLWRRV